MFLPYGRLMAHYVSSVCMRSWRTASPIARGTTLPDSWIHRIHLLLCRLAVGTMYPWVAAVGPMYPSPLLVREEAGTGGKARQAGRQAGREQGVNGEARVDEVLCLLGVLELQALHGPSGVAEEASRRAWGRRWCSSPRSSPRSSPSRAESWDIDASRASTLLRYARWVVEARGQIRGGLQSVGSTCPSLLAGGPVHRVAPPWVFWWWPSLPINSVAD